MEEFNPINKNKAEEKKEMREPKWIGSGIHVHEIKKDDLGGLVKGDLYGDADWGVMKWDGDKWVSND